MQIRFNIKGLEKVKSYLVEVPIGVAHIVIETIGNHVNKGLQEAEPYKFITRKSAYGRSFFTPKQRRWFFWALGEGLIDPGKDNRTGASEKAWTFTQESNIKGTIRNDTPGAWFTRSDVGQARQPALVGWLKSSMSIAKIMPEAMKAAQAKAKAYLQSRK
jgi:hypothetical protein